MNIAQTPRPAAQTYVSKAESDADKEKLSDLIGALNATAGALSKDACGSWHIAGTRGTIHFDGVSWTIYVRCRSALAWAWSKKKLAMPVTQDGHDDGVLRLDALPDRKLASKIRAAIGLRKAPSLSAEERERRAVNMKLVKSPPLQAERTPIKEGTAASYSARNGAGVTTLAES